MMGPVATPARSCVMVGDTDAEREIERLRDKLAQTSSRTQHTLSRLVRDIPSPVLVTDDSGRFIMATASACALLGYTRDELLATTIADITAPPSQGAQERLWNSFTRVGRQMGRYDLIRKDGTAIDISYDAFWDVAPGVHVAFIRSQP
jgi:PAS domain S-box-containing protein